MRSELAGVDARSVTPGGERGMSLVEATIILAVLSVLTAMLAPSARTYVENARNVKAKHDVTAVGAAISQVLRDTGMLCLSLNGSSCANTATGRVELLVSGTAVGTNEPTVVATPLTVSASTASSTTLNWAGGVNEVADARRDLMDVRDTVRAYRLMVERANPGDIFNVCTGTAITIRELLDRLIARARVKVSVAVDPARMRPNDTPLLLGDPTRIRETLGWTPQISLDQTVDDLLEYWRNSS